MTDQEAEEMMARLVQVTACSILSGRIVITKDQALRPYDEVDTLQSPPTLEDAP